LRRVFSLLNEKGLLRVPVITLFNLATAWNQKLRLPLQYGNRVI